MHDCVHNLPLDFPVTKCILTLFLHMHWHDCLLCGLCIHLHTRVLVHACTQVHTNMCMQAHRALGSCWELPVYLINSTWLEAKDMQNGKGKVNNTKLKYFPLDLLWRKKHFPMTGKVKERGGEKG